MTEYTFETVVILSILKLKPFSAGVKLKKINFLHNFPLAHMGYMHFNGNQIAIHIVTSVTHPNYRMCAATEHFHI